MPCLGSNKCMENVTGIINVIKEQPTVLSAPSSHIRKNLGLSLCWAAFYRAPSDPCLLSPHFLGSTLPYAMGCI